MLTNIKRPFSFNKFAADSNPDTVNDLVSFFDVTAGVHKKLTIDQLFDTFSGGGLPAGSTGDVLQYFGGAFVAANALKYNNGNNVFDYDNGNGFTFYEILTGNPLIDYNSAGSFRMYYNNKIRFDLGSGNLRAFNELIAVNLDGYVLNDNLQRLSHDFNGRSLLTETGLTMMQYGNGFQRFLDASGTPSLLWNLRQLRDTTSTSALDWSTRTLKSTAGATVFDWNTRTLTGTWNLASNGDGFSRLGSGITFSGNSVPTSSINILPSSNFTAKPVSPSGYISLISQDDINELGISNTGVFLQGNRVDMVSLISFAGLSISEFGVNITGSWSFGGGLPSETSTGWTAFSNVTPSKLGLDALTATTADIVNYLAALHAEQVTKGIIAT